MSVEDEKFQSSNECWIRNKLFKNEDCSINIKLTKNVPVIFHNLRGYESHLIMQEIDKFDVKINVLPNGLEKYKAFTINKNLFLLTAWNL